MDTKVCCKCKEVKTLDGFSKRKASKDGHQTKCKACVKEYDAKWCASNPEKRKDIQAKYRAANPEKIREYNAEWCAANPDYHAEYRAANPDYHAEYRAANIENIKDYYAKWCAANPEKCRTYSSNYRAVKLEAIPSWLTEEDWQSMEAIGKEADRLTKETGIKHEVDHIHPLQPPKVIMFEGEMIPLICAFHCPSNFQILTKSENCSKGNRFTSYVESELTY